jgi:hypothetical protein
VRGLQQPRDHVGRHRTLQARAEQRLGLSLVEGADLELGEPGRVEPAHVAAARGHQQRDRLGLEAPRGEDERLGRRRVEPLGVVDAAQHRAALARLGEEAEQAGRDQEAVAHGVEAQPQRAAQGRRLGRGQALEEVQARAHELVHARERQLVLGLDADAAQQRHVRGAVGGVLEQRALADPGLAAQHERGAALAACALQQRIEGRLLRLAPDEHLGAILIPRRAGARDWEGD